MKEEVIRPGKFLEIEIEGFFRNYITPPVPKLETIAGYSLPKHRQKWIKPYIPNDAEAALMTKTERDEFIKRELLRRIDGYWFYNNGVPTYITGDHYFTLTYWFMGALTKDGYPEYRRSAAKWFYVLDMADKDPNCYGTIMMCQKRFGKALDLNTLIPTPDGFKKMADISVGDYVFGSDGKPTKVVFDSGIQYNRNCYNVVFSDGSSVIADEEHRWLVSIGLDNRKVVYTTKQILESNKDVFTEYYGGLGIEYGVKKPIKFESISEVLSRPVKCIQVDNEDHTYLCTENYIVTHNTEYALAKEYNMATLIETDCLFGMQSLNSTEAKTNLFKNRLMRSHKRIPNWLKPVSNETNSRKEIVSELTFMGEKNPDGTYKSALNNIIDHRPTLVSAYQGKRPRFVFLDEPGSVEEMSLIDWWTTVREQLALGKNIFGRANLPTTLEDLKRKGAIEFIDLWNKSDPTKVDKNGRTASGLWRYFKPYYLGREGFIDEFGNDLIEEAKQFRANQLEMATPADAEKIKRQYPETEEDAFGIVTGGVWEADVKEILETSLKAALANDETKYYKVIKYGSEIRFNPCKKEDQDAVMILEQPVPNVRYGVGIDCPATDNDTGSPDGSSFGFCITKGFGGMGLSYAPVCVYEFRPDKLEEGYRVISALIEYYGATAGKDLLKVMGETNAGATNLLNYLINNGLKPFMAKKPKSLGINSQDKKSGNTDLYWIYRTDDVKEYQKLLANRFIRKYGHNFKIPRLLKSLLNLGVVNADAADGFLTSLMLFQDFDKVSTPGKQVSRSKWVSKWNAEKGEWEWSCINS